MPWPVFAGPLPLRNPWWTAWIEFSAPTGFRHPHLLFDVDLGFET